MKNVILIYLLFIMNYQGFSQILDSENKVIVELSDKSKVILYGAKILGSEQQSNNYYYLPTNLRLSQNRNGTPQFLYVQYATDDKLNTKDTSGAILHLLLELGLTKELEAEVKSGLRKKKPGSILMGPAVVIPDGENSVQLISSLVADKNDQHVILTKRAPTMPGSKIAISAQLNSLNSQILAATFNQTKSITDLSLSLYYKYTLSMPAVNGYIIEDWSKIDSLYNKEKIKYSRKTPWWQTVFNAVKPLAIAAGSFANPGGTAAAMLGGVGKMDLGDNSKYSYSELKDIFHDLQEAKIIQFVFEETQVENEEKIKIIREMFFDYFKDRFTKASADAPNQNAIPTASTDNPGIKSGALNSNSLDPATIKNNNEIDPIKNELFKKKSFTFKSEFYSLIKQRSTNKINLRVSLPVQRDFSITENMLSWYNAVKDNPKCMTKVIAADPLYGNREINVMLDMDAQDMFKKVVNYVSVDIRKQRSQNGYFDFSTQTTFDKNTLELPEGNKKSFSISKIMDQDIIPFQYRVKWSLKGGVDYYEKDSIWQKGDWLGISLNSPLTQQKLIFETDVERLIEQNIRYVDLEIRYTRFGKELDHNIRMRSTFQGESIIDTIYMDKSSPGYIYRLVYTHKDMGKLATEWQPNLTFERIDANIPPEIVNKETPLINKLIEQFKVKYKNNLQEIYKTR